MRKENWIETKKEYEINEEGESILKRTTHELNNIRKKDIVDYVLRILGLAAIFIPVIIFFMQQSKERENQKRLFEFETYTNATMNIQLLLNKNKNSVSFENAWNDFYFKDYPRIKYLRDNAICTSVDSIKSYLSTYLIFSDVIISFDTLYNFLQKVIETGQTDIYLADNSKLTDVVKTKINATINDEYKGDTMYLDKKILKQLYNKILYFSTISPQLETDSAFKLWRIGINGLILLKEEIRLKALMHNKVLDSIVSEKLKL